MSIVERERRDPHWLSGRITFALDCSFYRRILPDVSPHLRIAKCHPSFCILQLSKHLCTVVVLAVQQMR